MSSWKSTQLVDRVLLAIDDAPNDELMHPALPQVKDSSVDLRAALSKLCCLAYWDRVWIMQEYGLSLHKRLLYGDTEITGKDIENFFYELFMFALERKHELSKFHAITTSECWNLVLTNWRDTTHAYQRELAIMYRTSRKRKSSDFHDRIYGLRAVFYDGALFPVDYTLSPLELALSILSFCMRNLVNGFSRRDLYGTIETIDYGYCLKWYSSFASTVYWDFGLSLVPDSPDGIVGMYEQSCRAEKILRFANMTGVEIGVDEVVEFSTDDTNERKSRHETLERCLYLLFGRRMEIPLDNPYNVTQDLLGAIASGTVYLLKCTGLMLITSGGSQIHRAVICVRPDAAYKLQPCQFSHHLMETIYYSAQASPSGLEGIWIDKGSQLEERNKAPAKLVLEDSLAGVALFGLPRLGFLRRRECFRALGSSLSWTISECNAMRRLHKVLAESSAAESRIAALWLRLDKSLYKGRRRSV